MPTDHFVPIQLLIDKQRTLRHSELKWNDVTDYSKREDAERVITAVVHLARQRNLRVDVFIWDSRSRVNELSVTQWYKVLFKTVNLHWKNWIDHSVSQWLLFVDQQGELDESNLIMSLQDLHDFPSSILRQINSQESLMVQVADVFAGMGPHSYINSRRYRRWLRRPAIRLSNRDTYRFPILTNFHNLCIEQDMGISLDDKMSGFRSNGLWTMNAENPINFQPVVEPLSV